MASSQSELEEECFVYPAITKRYSEISVPENENSSNDKKLEINCNKIHLSNPSRPLRSTLKQKSQFDTVNPKDVTFNNNTSKNSFEVNNHKNNLHILNNNNKLFNSTFKNKNQFNTMDFYSDSKSNLQRPSIQHLRKYSVVDPNTLKFVEGNF